MTFRLLVLASLSLVLLGLVAAPRMARAQGNIACSNRRQASKEFNKGRLAYRRGDYEEAILKWQESYAICQEPLIHLNIANAYERLGQPKPALDHLRLWRQAAPLREHAELDARIATLEASVAEEEKKKKAEEERRAAEAAAQAQPSQPPQPQPIARRRGPRTTQIVGFTLAGVGGAAVIAGVIMDVVAATSRPDEATACRMSGGSNLCLDDMADEIANTNTLAIAGDITWIAGAVIAAGGATVLVLDATGVIGKKPGADQTAPPPRAPPAPGISSLFVAPYGAGAQLFGTFQGF